MLGLPVAAYSTWNGVLLERTGATPDVLSCDALRTGSDVQLQKSIDVVEQL